MPRRAIHWTVLGFAALWFNVVLPVHTRGMLTLGPAPAPAQRAAQNAAHACCATSGHASRPASKAPGHCPDGHGRRGGACAVCFFMAGLSTPPAVTSVERRLAYTGDLRVALHTAPDAARYALPLNSRAPPLA